MRRGISIVFVSSLLFFSPLTSVFGSWLIFHKPDFKGRIIDADTKQPIEGVVVVALYRSHPIISGPGGGSSSVIHAKEALTDSNGEFLIPAYTTLIQPNSYDFGTDFIIYKAGYASYTRLYHNRIFPLKYCGPEILFSKKLGTEGEIRRGSEVITIKYGLVELPKLETRGERLRASPGTPSGFYEEELPLLYKEINDERKRFGLGEIGLVQDSKILNPKKPPQEHSSPRIPSLSPPNKVPRPPPRSMDQPGYSPDLREIPHE